MEIMELMRARHSVRKYRSTPIEAEKRTALQRAVEEVNEAGNLRFRLFTEEPEAFAANAAHYGAFSGCRNYFALVGPAEAEEAVGYYGEKLVLLAQALGLNTCWVVLTYKKGRVAVEPAKGEKLHGVIALGYGETQGQPHRSKALADLADLRPDDPDWYRSGLEAALLAPTAVNQQKFHISRQGDTVTARAKAAFYAKMDLGIVKYHFEQGAGRENFRWA